MNYFIKLGREFGHAYMSFFNSLDQGSERMQIDLGFYGLDNAKNSWTQKERLAYEIYLMLKGGIKNFDSLSKIISIVMKEYFSIIPIEIQKKVLEQAGLGAMHVVGRTAAANMLTKVILRKVIYEIAGNAVADKVVKVVERSILRIILPEAIADASVRGCDYLSSNFPKLYTKLYNEKVEALFFIVRKPLQKYLDLIKLCHTNKSAFEAKICKMYQNILN